MRIGLVSSTQQSCPPKGYGSEAATYDLACALSRGGHEVTLFAPAGSKTPPGGSLILLPRAKDGEPNKRSEAFAVEKYRGACADLDVIHDLSLSCGAHEAACREFACGTIGPAHCCTLNGISYSGLSDPWKHNVIVVSEAAKRHADGRGAWYGTPYPNSDTGTLPNGGADAFVVRYGRDPDFYRPVAPRAIDDYILYTGRPHVAKGIDLILDLAAAWPQQRFVLAWRADLPDHRAQEATYRSRIAALPNVAFEQLPAEYEAHHARKRDLMARARVLLHPNVYVDADPVVPKEAQLCGTPVVAWDRGGLRESCLPDRTAVLRPLPSIYWQRPAEVAALLKGMCREAFDLDRGLIRRYAEVSLSADRMAREYVGVYERIVKR